MTVQTSERLLEEIYRALGGTAEARARFTGAGASPSAFAVSDLAAASIAAAGLALSELVGARGGPMPKVEVDRRLASLWFNHAIRPLGWKMPPVWDDIAGDYRTADQSWIRIHTNRPHHRAAALSVLKVEPPRANVEKAVAQWRASDLEGAIVAANGAAAALRSRGEWAMHSQGIAVAAEPLVHHMEAGAAPLPRWALARENPLAGIRILDLTRILAGPVATRFLAGYGADVLRIDPPGWNEPAIVPEVTLGKRCATLDLKTPTGHGALKDLIAEADVVVHGYRPGALTGLGFSETRRRALKPALIDASLDAYGWTGPWRTRRGYDSLVQMSSGLAAEGMRAASHPISDAPVSLPFQALDHATGYLLAAAILRALAARATSGAGATIRVSLARTAALLLQWRAEGDEPAFAAETEADIAPAIESTSWGPARRLRWPLNVEGATLRWEHPASALGMHPAEW
jgi:hypothetical protein